MLQHNNAWLPFMLKHNLQGLGVRKIVGFYPFEQKLAVAWPPAAWQDVTVLVAVSGGADSVALLRALAALCAAGLQPAELVIIIVIQMKDSSNRETAIGRASRQLKRRASVKTASLETAA
jgi:tRNA(Ile)-lysidine synthase TilS/MesJ